MHLRCSFQIIEDLMEVIVEGKGRSEKHDPITALFKAQHQISKSNLLERKCTFTPEHKRSKREQQRLG